MQNEYPQGEKLAVVLFGSPHPNGCTSQLLQVFLKQLDAQYRIITINAYEKNILPCTACGYCEKVDGCKYRDFEDIDRLLRTADLLIVATPAYNLTFPAPLKAIFDRMQRYFSLRFAQGIKPPIKKHKRAVLLLTCGSYSDESAWILRRQLTMIFTVINATLEQEVVWKNTDREQDVTKTEQYTKAAADAICASD